MRPLASPRLHADLRLITGTLPDFQPIDRRSEADYYGASDLISAALGYPAPPQSIASWKHGVSYDREVEHPELLLTEGNRATRHLVPTQWQADRLRSIGFLRVHAVGVPFLYADPAPASRAPLSLLVMPAHSLTNSRHAFDEEAYVDAIVSIRERFNLVLACISASCVRNGKWTRAFERRGIPWIPGADSTDRHALRRMARLFASVEFVTTNTLGSHVAYAAYSGCKVSLWGPYAEHRIEHFRGVPWYEKNWDKLSRRLERLSESHVKRAHPWLFADPWQAGEHRAWSHPFLGAREKRDAAEVARLLGWSRSGSLERRAHQTVKGSVAFTRALIRRLRQPAAGTRGRA